MKLLPACPWVEEARRRLGWGWRGLLRRRRRWPPSRPGWVVAVQDQLLADQGRPPHKPRPTNALWHVLHANDHYQRRRKMNRYCSLL